MISTIKTYSRVRAEDGFSLILVMTVLLISSLLIAAGLTATVGDIHLSSAASNHTQAYYAALAGVQEYDYELQNNPDFWQECGTIANKAEENAFYEVKVLPAETAPTGTTACNSASPFTTAIESKGKFANTFRIEATGCSGAKELTSCPKQSSSKMEVRTVVATFGVTGFLDFAYFTQYEDEDFTLNGGSQAECEQYYAVRQAKKANCTEIQFAPADGVRGPMHTDDAANSCGNVEFGRKERLEQGDPDAIEVNGGVNNVCSGSATFNTASGSYTKGAELKAPESDTSLKLYVEPANELEGDTHLVLNGSANTIEVTHPSGTKETMSWPKNGLLYVAKMEKGGVCTYEFEGVAADLTNEPIEEEGCGTVYVSGTYSKSLTIAAERELIINGNLIPTGVTAGAAPTGTQVLGLIATRFVRVYHPVEQTYARSGFKCSGSDTEVTSGVCERVNTQGSCDAENVSGTLESPWIYAAILSTSHSLVNDNYDCGSNTQLGKLNIYGAIAQKFRGIVGITGSHGYLKNYVYDERLATDEPPYFLAPLKAGWKILRETSPQAG
jgi:Tfp pilus assembly protein PilX